MANFDTTATVNYDARVNQALPTNTLGTAIKLGVEMVTANYEHTLLSGILPQKPTGAVRINRVTLVWTYLFAADGLSHTDKIAAWGLSSPWIDTQTTWNVYATGNSWTKTGGDWQAFLTNTAFATPSKTRRGHR